MGDETRREDRELRDLAERLYEGVDVDDRTHRLRTYEDCFVGREAVTWLVDTGAARDREQAVALGNLLVDAGYVHHVLREHGFADDELFYRFARDEDHGRKQQTFSGETVGWRDLLGMPQRPGRRSLQPEIPSDAAGEIGASALGVEPMDAHNVALLDAVHPPWENPAPEGRYNMVVVGAGTGGLVTAAAVAGLGGKVALVEEHLMGGDCLNFGCVPSKALLRCARAVADVRRAGDFGVRIHGDVRVDFGAVMERMRRLRSEIAPHDSAERFADELGVDVFLGHGEFVGEHTLRVGDRELEFARACIATGARPAIPPIDGLDDVDYLTNASLFNLTELPERLGVLGAGPIGCEIAQAFARLGSDVTVFEMAPQILPREDDDAAEVVRHALTGDGVTLRVDTAVERVEAADHAIRLVAGDEPVVVDALLVAAGRHPNVDGLGLEAAGVELDADGGVAVDDRLRTTNPAVFAVGDVATRYRFTHAADFMARMVVRNALFFGRESFDDLLIPWCTYTDPEIAHVGLYPDDLDERGIAHNTYRREFADVDRALLEGETDGFVKLHVEAGSDEILGATIVGPHAGDLISEVSVAIEAGMGLGELASVIHPYPTVAEAIRQAGDAYNRDRLTTTVSAALRTVLRLRR